MTKPQSRLLSVEMLHKHGMRPCKAGLTSFREAFGEATKLTRKLARENATKFTLMDIRWAAAKLLTKKGYAKWIVRIEMKNLEIRHKQLGFEERVEERRIAYAAVFADIYIKEGLWQNRKDTHKGGC